MDFSERRCPIRVTNSERSDHGPSTELQMPVFDFLVGVQYNQEPPNPGHRIEWGIMQSWIVTFALGISKADEERLMRSEITVSHLCALGGCISPGHWILENLNENGSRRSCHNLGFFCWRSV